MNVLKCRSKKKIKTGHIGLVRVGFASGRRRKWTVFLEGRTAFVGHEKWRLGRPRRGFIELNVVLEN